jgi:tRNA nucleotidyltransferase (CCA-adding enzyme)
VPQPEKWHPEIDCGLHTMLVLQQAAHLSDQAGVRFAALVHDLGKARTDKELWPAHHGHERKSVELVHALAARFPIPNAFRDLGLLAAEFHGHCHRAFELRAETILKVLERTDAFRRPERFEQFLLACEADSRGRTGFEQRPYPQADYFRDALQAARAVPVSAADAAGARGAEIGERLRKKRLAALDSLKSEVDQPPK